MLVIKNLIFNRQERRADEEHNKMKYTVQLYLGLL